jgi:hypothetical protein
LVALGPGFDTSTAKKKKVCNPTPIYPSETFIRMSTPTPQTVYINICDSYIYDGPTGNNPGVLQQAMNKQWDKHRLE